MRKSRIGVMVINPVRVALDVNDSKCALRHTLFICAHDYGMVAL
ncbi:hypothetical protein ACLQ2N_02105 [Streptomyces sp. DT224]|nr:hypothetical protein [Streptomyces sp. or43]